jgi:hypothetical protein
MNNCETDIRLGELAVEAWRNRVSVGFTAKRLENLAQALAWVDSPLEGEAL